MQKKVLIYGEDWVGTLPRLLNDDLSGRGYKVAHFDFTNVIPGIKDRLFYQRLKRRVFYKYYVRAIQIEFLKIFDRVKPDVVFVIKGLHLQHETLQNVRANGAMLVNWNPDDFFNMKNSTASLAASLPLYDLIVSSREHLFSKYKEHGAAKVLYLDWYYVPSLHFERHFLKTIPASFVGSWSPFRENFIGCFTPSFMIWGAGWDKSSREFQKKHHVQNKILSQVDMCAVFNKSRYNLNLLTPENSDTSNLRFFEIPASGGLLLTERNCHASRHLVDGKECLMYSSIDEACSLVSDQLDLDDIAHAGHLRITSGGNAFSDRVDTLLYHI